MGASGLILNLFCQASHERQDCAVEPRSGSRWHRHSGGGRKEIMARWRPHTTRHWTGKICGEGVGMEKWVSSWEKAWNWASFLSPAQSKLRLCSANHRPGYWSNLPCDWPSTAWAYSEQETENTPCSVSVEEKFGLNYRAPHIPLPDGPWQVKLPG